MAVYRTPLPLGSLVPTLFMAVLAGACAPAALRAPPPPPEPPRAFDPQGSWQYTDKLVSGLIHIDEHGRGRYEWRQGRFETVAIKGRRWTGTWHQPGNDREGGFELLLSSDYSEARGRWWYTRIGTNLAPKRPGGRFRLTRVPNPAAAP